MNLDTLIIGSAGLYIDRKKQPGPGQVVMDMRPEDRAAIKDISSADIAKYRPDILIPIIEDFLRWTDPSFSIRSRASELKLQFDKSMQCK